MSRPQVTITLGRSGQVVKRAGTRSDDSHSDYVSSSGSKRPARERLGSNTDNPELYSKGKRQRKDVNDGNQYIPNSWVNEDDLRHKLMRKNFSRRTRNGGDEQIGVDLRAKLSRIVHAPRLETRQRVFEHKASTLPRRIPPTRSADDLLHMDSLTKSYSAWRLDGVRHRSPDGLLGVSRGMSPSRDADELRRLPSIRPVNAPRSSAYMTKGAMEVTRPTTFTTKGPVALEAAKTVSRFPPPVMTHKNPYSVRVEEPLTVASLLHSLGLDKYSIHFQAEEIDMTALKQMGDTDLKELGIPMGPRKKILLALLSRAKYRKS